MIKIKKQNNINTKCYLCGNFYYDEENPPIDFCYECNEKKIKEKDMVNFSDIYNKQLELQKRLGYSEKELLNNQQFINVNILALLDELSEAMRETQWKNPNFIKYGWKKTQEFNKDKFKEELIDILHFFVNLCISSGMDSKEIYQRYMGKNKENFKRQDEGY